MIKESISFFVNMNPWKNKVIYLQGVPNLNDNFVVRFIPSIQGLQISDTLNNKKVFLKKEDIISLSVEDQSSIQSRVGFKRLLLVGIFALAWKKKEKVSLSYLIIEYKDEFGDTQELFLQSEENTGYQHFVNIKYNLQKYWKEVTELDEAEIEKKEKPIFEDNPTENNQVIIGCFAIIVIMFIFIIALTMKK